MRAMAYKLFSSLKSHPLITAFSVLLLFTLPIFHMLMFFWPLIVSTALGVLAVVSFGRQSDEHTTPIAGCGTVESAGHPDIITFPPYEEKISNVLMVGNREVTWLEWLHNEDTQKLCTNDHEPAVCDAHGFDVSSMASVASLDAPAEDKLSVYANGSTCEDEAIDNASLCAEEKGRLYVCGGEDETRANGLVLIEENEIRVASITSTALDVCRGATNVLEDVNRGKTAEDEIDLDLTGKDQMCRFGLTCEDETKNVPKGNGIASKVDEGSDTQASACAEGDERQIRVEGLYQTGGGGNDCKPTQGLLDSTIYIKNGVDGYRGDEVVGNVDALVLGATKSHASTIDSEGVMNKCVSASGIEGETSLHVPVSTLKAEIGVDALDFPSPTAAISHVSEPKFAHIYEKDVLDLPSSNKTMSPLLKMEGAEVHDMQHVDEQDEEERDSKQLVTQGPQWDVSDGEEDQSSLRFSFFHNRSFMPSKA